MVYTIHHGEGGLGAPGCPRSDTCPRRKVAQRWPSDPSREIDPRRSLVFFANRPFKFCYSNLPFIFFCKKTRPLHPIYRNVPPSSPASIPPPPGSHRPPSLPFSVSTPSPPLPFQDTATVPPHAASARRPPSTVEGADGGSRPATSRRSNGRRIQSSGVKVDRRAADPGGGVEAVQRPADPGDGMERAADPNTGVEAMASAATLVSRRQRERRREQDGRRRHPGRGAGGGNAGDVHRRAVPCFLFSSQYSFSSSIFSLFSFLPCFLPTRRSAFFT